MSQLTLIGSAVSLREFQMRPPYWQFENFNQGSD